jgi:retron-type reverse transcriptase
MTFGIDSIKSAFEDKVSLTKIKGLDGITVEKFEPNKIKQFEIISKKLLNGIYKFTPYLELLKSKGRSKPPRVISLPTIRDRIVLFLLKDVLHKIFPECVNRELPNANVRKIKEFLHSSDCKMMMYHKIDLASFYDSIDHRILLDMLIDEGVTGHLLNLIRKSLKTPTVQKGSRNNSKERPLREKGVPQGLSVSNILAGVYLHRFDKLMMDASIKYFRYVDDILIFCETEKSNELLDLLEYNLKSLCLSVNSDKSASACGNIPFEFLGYSFQEGAVTVRRTSIERFLRRIAAVISSFKNKIKFDTKAEGRVGKGILKEVFLSDLNEKITGAISGNKRYGWIFYYLEITDITVLYEMDAVIHSMFNDVKKFGFAEDVHPKKMVKAYFEIKFNVNSPYIHNYDVYDTIPKKVKYLMDRGYIDPKSEKGLSPTVVERMFARVIRKNLSGLDMDAGDNS